MPDSVLHLLRAAVTEPYPPCVAALFLALGSSVLTTIPFAPGGLGLVETFLIAAFMVEQFSSLFARLKGHLVNIERAMGVLMIITGIGFLTGTVSNVSVWLLETFPSLQSFG